MQDWRKEHPQYWRRGANAATAVNVGPRDLGAVLVDLIRRSKGHLHTEEYKGRARERNGDSDQSEAGKRAVNSAWRERSRGGDSER